MMTRSLIPIFHQWTCTFGSYKNQTCFHAAAAAVAAAVAAATATTTVAPNSPRAATLSLTCRSKSNSRVIHNNFGYRYFGTSSKNNDGYMLLSPSSSSSAAAAELSDDEILERFRKYIESSKNSSADDDITEEQLSHKTLCERLQWVEDILHKSVSNKTYNPRQKYRGRDYIYFLMRKHAPSKNKCRRINKQLAQAKLDELVYTRHALRHGYAKLKLLQPKALSESFLGPGCKESVSLAMARKILKEQWRWGRSSLLEDLEQKVAERRARTKFVEERTALNRKRRRREAEEEQDLEKTLPNKERAKKCQEEGATAN